MNELQELILIQVFEVQGVFGHKMLSEANYFTKLFAEKVLMNNQLNSIFKNVIKGLLLDSRMNTLPPLHVATTSHTKTMPFDDVCRILPTDSKSLDIQSVKLRIKVSNVILWSISLK